MSILTTANRPTDQIPLLGESRGLNGPEAKNQGGITGPLSLLRKLVAALFTPSQRVTIAAPLLQSGQPQSMRAPAARASLQNINGISTRRPPVQARLNTSLKTQGSVQKARAQRPLTMGQLRTRQLAKLDNKINQAKILQRRTQQISQGNQKMMAMQKLAILQEKTQLHKAFLQDFRVAKKVFQHSANSTLESSAFRQQLHLKAQTFKIINAKIAANTLGF